MLDALYALNVSLLNREAARKYGKTAFSPSLEAIVADLARDVAVLREEVLRRKSSRNSTFRREDGRKEPRETAPYLRGTNVPQERYCEIVRVTFCSKSSTWLQVVGRKSRRAERREETTHSQRISILQRQGVNKKTEQSCLATTPRRTAVTITVPRREVGERTPR